MEVAIICYGLLTWTDGLRFVHDKASSKALAMRISRSSFPKPATNCIPIGRPAALWHRGSETAGRPVALNKLVKVLNLDVPRYHCFNGISWFWWIVPKGTGVCARVGVSSKSYFSKNFPTARRVVFQGVPGPDHIGSRVLACTVIDLKRHSLRMTPVDQTIHFFRKLVAIKTQGGSPHHPQRPEIGFKIKMWHCRLNKMPHICAHSGDSVTFAAISASTSTPVQLAAVNATLSFPGAAPTSFR